MHAVDKFPRMVVYVVPTGTLADASRIRLGAYLGEGTTVMHEGRAQLQRRHTRRGHDRGPHLPARSRGRRLRSRRRLRAPWARCPAAARSGVSIGERCLIGANGGTGISLGDRCTIAAGVYVTAGTPIAVLDEHGAMRPRK